MAFQYPETSVFYRKLTKAFPRIVRGEGVQLFDDAGRRYLDGSGGACVANLGHGVTEIAAAMAAQAAQLGYVTGMTFTHDAVEQFSSELAALCPGDLDFVYPLASGSEAVEAALKLARQYWVEAGKPAKHRIIALAPAYHGNTLLALSASAREHYKTFYRPWLVDVEQIPAPYPYRAAPEALNGDALEAAILRLGPENVAAFIAEPVGGSSTGASVPPDGYFQRVRAICDKYDVLLIADEVLVGAGRTGSFSAIAPTGVVPDLLTLGKGITGGYAPLSALVAPRRIVDVIARGSGSFLHAQTFSHHPVLCAAGLATLDYLRTHKLVERCAEVGARFHEKLQALRALPHVGDVRGRGLLAGIEFVEDAATKAPFPRAAHFAETFSAEALKAGLVVWVNVGQADGTNGDLAMLAPPFTVTDAELDEIIAAFSAALQATVRQVHATARSHA